MAVSGKPRYYIAFTYLFARFHSTPASLPTSV